MSNQGITQVQQQPSSSNTNFSKKVANYSQQGIETYKKSSPMGKVIFFIILI